VFNKDMLSFGLLQAKVVLFKGYCVTDQQMICGKYEVATRYGHFWAIFE
jgi:hypothetical protein